MQTAAESVVVVCDPFFSGLHVEIHDSTVSWLEPLTEAQSEVIVLRSKTAHCRMTFDSSYLQKHGQRQSVQGDSDPDDEEDVVFDETAAIEQGTSPPPVTVELGPHPSILDMLLEAFESRDVAHLTFAYLPHELTLLGFQRALSLVAQRQLLDVGALQRMWNWTKRTLKRPLPDSPSLTRLVVLGEEKDTVTVCTSGFDWKSRIRKRGPLTAFILFNVATYKALATSADWKSLRLHAQQQQIVRRFKALSASERQCLDRSVAWSRAVESSRREQRPAPRQTAIECFEMDIPVVRSDGGVQTEEDILKMWQALPAEKRIKYENRADEWIRQDQEWNALKSCLNIDES